MSEFEKGIFFERGNISTRIDRLFDFVNFFEKRFSLEEIFDSRFPLGRDIFTS